MITKRFLEHLKNQHWTGVFIELVIVVLGVFIGLQVDNWNQIRQDRGLERQYLERLRDDMQSSIKNTDANIKFMRQQYQRDGKMLDELASCKLEGKDRNRFAAGIYNLGKISPPAMVMGTINELQSTGRLGLLRDLDLRKDLAKALQFSKRNYIVLQMILPRASQEVVYVNDQAVIKGSNYDYDKVMREGIPTDRFSFDFPSLCKDTRFASSIANVQQYVGTGIWQNENEQKIYRNLVKIIDHDLATGK